MLLCRKSDMLSITSEYFSGHKANFQRVLPKLQTSYNEAHLYPEQHMLFTINCAHYVVTSKKQKQIIFLNR